MTHLTTSDCRPGDSIGKQLQNLKYERTLKITQLSLIKNHFLQKTGNSQMR